MPYDGEHGLSVDKESLSLGSPKNLVLKAKHDPFGELLTLDYTIQKSIVGLSIPTWLCRIVISKSILLFIPLLTPTQISY